MDDDRNMQFCGTHPSMNHSAQSNRRIWEQHISAAIVSYLNVFLAFCVQHIWIIYKNPYRQLTSALADNDLGNPMFWISLLPYAALTYLTLWFVLKNVWLRWIIVFAYCALWTYLLMQRLTLLAYPLWP
jgi:hypothetical protein